MLNGFNIADVLSDYLSNPEFSTLNNIQGFVTRNDLFCNSTSECTLSDFDGIYDAFLDADLGYWIHIWENPNMEGEDCLLILAKSPFVNDPGINPISQDHEDFILNILELIKIDITLPHFPSQGERLSFALIDLLNEGFPQELIEVPGNQTICDLLELKLKSIAPEGTKPMTWFIERIKEEEAKYPVEEQRNTKLMLTRFRRIFYNTDGFNDILIPGGVSENSQSPYGSPLEVERSRITVDGRLWNTDLDLVDTEVYPIDPNTGERPEIYVNQQIKLDAGNYIGVYVDMGHVFAGLDAFNFPHPINIPGFMGNVAYAIEIEENFAATTWIGDLGSSLVYAQVNFNNYVEANGTPVPHLLVQEGIDRGTPPQDMVGNIDSYVIGNFYNISKESNGLKVSEILENYYLGIDIDHEDINVNGLEFYQNHRYSIFSELIGLRWATSPLGFNNETVVFDKFKDQIADSAAFFVGAGSEGSFVVKYWLALRFEENKFGKSLMELLVKSLQDEVLNE